VTVDMTDLAAEAGLWRPANDTVMGGVSTSRAERRGQALRFAGELSVENNGGFASIRRPFDGVAAASDAGASDVAGFALLVRGDGNRYRLRLYTRDRAGGENSFAYSAAFDTRAGETTRAELRWPQFSASFRGRPVPAAPPIRFADLTGIGVMITKADHRAGRGPFALELLRIEPLILGNALQGAPPLAGP
jgi:NADH dehydrogenase [ubiquinone] 1 alpha subcomplex assembly factor 1